MNRTAARVRCSRQTPFPDLPQLPACLPVFLQVDDPLDAIAVHAGCGVWGLLAAGAFAAPGMVTDVYGVMPGTEDGVSCCPALPVVPASRSS